MRVIGVKHPAYPKQLGGYMLHVRFPRGPCLSGYIRSGRVALFVTRAPKHPPSGSLVLTITTPGSTTARAPPPNNAYCFDAAIMTTVPVNDDDPFKDPSLPSSQAQQQAQPDIPPGSTLAVGRSASLTLVTDSLIVLGKSKRVKPYQSLTGKYR